MSNQAGNKQKRPNTVLEENNGSIRLTGTDMAAPENQVPGLVSPHETMELSAKPLLPYSLDATSVSGDAPTASQSQSSGSETVFIDGSAKISPGRAAQHTRKSSVSKEEPLRLPEAGSTSSKADFGMMHDDWDTLQGMDFSMFDCANLPNIDLNGIDNWWPATQTAQTSEISLEQLVESYMPR